MFDHDVKTLRPRSLISTNAKLLEDVMFVLMTVYRHICLSDMNDAMMIVSYCVCPNRLYNRMILVFIPESDLMTGRLAGVQRSGVMERFMLLQIDACLCLLCVDLRSACMSHSLWCFLNR